MRDYDFGTDGVGKPPETPSHGWIQWKGTNVCMDIHCQCGSTFHYDGERLYFWACGDCGRTYMVDGHIALRELPSDVKPCMDGVPLAVSVGNGDAELYTTGYGFEDVEDLSKIVWPPWWDGPKEPATAP